MSATETNERIPTDEEITSRRKAVDITIDSLKQYITLSTVAIAGLLAFFNGNGKDGSKILFVIAVTGFILCAILSVFIINTFINKVHKNIIDVRLLTLRIPNFIAIVFFVIGVTTTALFFFSGINVSPIKKAEDSKIIIQEKRIEIGKDVNTKVIIKTDSLFHEKTILVNQQNQ